MDLIGKKVVVTGGAGFIGSHLVDALLENGAEVVIIDDLSASSIGNVNKKAVFYEVNIIDDSIEEIFRKESPEIVFHLASNTNVPRSIEYPLYESNSLFGALRVIDVCRRIAVSRFIFTSSGFVYGNTKRRPIAESELFKPISPYAISKNSIENYLRFYKDVHGLSYVTLRFATVYGPRQKKGAMADYIEKLHAGSQAEFYGDGSKTRDYVYIDDIIAVLLKSLDIEKFYDEPVFNIGSGVETSLKELYCMIAELLGRVPEPVIMPDRPGELNGYSLDSSKAKNVLNWEPACSLSQGLLNIMKYRRLV
ncbi:MAG: NAD-dependent epimerase/dehydratase family protein [Desulfobacula sp.]|jgi:UDP-glucose 4-epimerase|nr:NAD-dependent epimerase/dehydratase family protein [Desulfobacula sp.]